MRMPVNSLEGRRDLHFLLEKAVETLGAFCGVPVCNGLTDAWQPTQLADILTMRDRARAA